MSASDITDLSKLCLHTITTKAWNLRQCAENYAKAGMGGITIWRDCANAHEGGLKDAGEICRNEGLEIVSYVRGGFFTGLDAATRQRSLDDNRKMIDEAAELGAPLIVLVCGATPGQSLQTSRKQITEALSELAPYAKQAGVKLGIEPLHPMYADSRSAVNTLTQALDMSIDVGSEMIGVTADVFHLWWDDRLQPEIARCGAAGKLFTFHICDWKNQPLDMLNDRGLMGEGVIDVRGIRGWVENAGFNGYNEVEIFSTLHWAKDPHAFLAEVIEAYRTKS